MANNQGGSTIARTHTRTDGVFIQFKWGTFGWYIQLPDGRAARGLTGKARQFPKYFPDAKSCIAWADRHPRDIERQAKATGEVTP